MKEMRRILALVLCFVMLVGILPVSALATDTVPAETSVVETTESPANAVEDDEVADDTQDEIIVDDTQDDQTVPADDTLSKSVPAADANAGIATAAASADDGIAVAAASDVTYVLACSDFQNSSGDSAAASTVTSILSAVDDDYTTMDGFLFGGDLSYNMSTSASTSGKKALQNVIQATYGTAMDEVYVQGNHDPDDTVGSVCSDSGEHDTEDYGVYVINEKDYPWGYNTTDLATPTKATAEALDAYLDAKVVEGYSKPVFVVSHLPLHYTSRTSSQGDGSYAKYIYDVLDEAGDKGLNIIFLFGHNHSSGYDAYLGNGSIYLAEGSTITIANEGSKTSYYTDTLSFTYMNYGYVGYIGGSGDTELTMTVFEIEDNKITVNRYNDKGLYSLKAAGVTSSGNPTADTSVVASGQTITLTTPTVEEKVTKEDNNVSVTAPGLTGLTVTKVAGTADNTDETYSAYASYDITPEGYTAGKSATVTITLDEADGFDASKKVVVIDVDGDNADQTVSIVDGTVTFTTNHFSTYNAVQTAETGDSGTTGTIWRETSSITEGKNYMLVNYGSNADGIATYAVNSTAGATAVNVQTDSTGAYVVNNDMALAWTAEAGGTYNFLKNASTGNYLNSSNYGDSSGTALSVASETATYSDWFINNSLLSVSNKGGSSRSYPLAYTGSGFAVYGNGETPDNGVVIFEETSETGTDSGSGSGSGSGSTVTTEGGDWVTISDGVGKIIYKLDEDGVDSGSKYLIVSDEEAVAMSAVATSDNAVDITFNDDQTEAYPTSTDYEWTIEASDSGYKMYNTDGDYIGRSSSSISNDSADVWSISGNGDGTYTIENDSYQLRYSGSNSVFQISRAWSSDYIVRLYKYETTQAAGDAEYAKIDGELTYTVSRGATAEEALAAVMAGIDVVISADKSAETTLDDTNTDITWTIDSSYGDGSTPGEYAVTISYKGVKLGVAKVIVPEATINGITVSPASGSVTVGASEAALVGATITVDVADDEGDDFTVAVTVGMLSGDFTTATAGTYGGLTVTYNGFTYEGFTLTVKEKVVNNYPSFPNEGAVKVEKTSTGINFQSTGVAKVELSASGVPMNQGVDVLLVLDTSSSMGFQGSLTDEDSTRIDVLKDCVNALITNLKADRADGSESEIDIAILDFNGYFDNKEVNYISSAAKDTSTYGSVLTDGWVDIQSLSDTWATTNIPEDGSGTNYDHGLQQAYDLLAQKQADNGDNTRKQFVLFMSDGAPFQYNGVSSNSTKEDWAKWILGSYTQEEVDEITTIQNKDFYFGNNNGEGQKHFIAEAIKGSPDNSYNIPVYSNTTSSATGSLESVSGLGATIYSVGLALEATNMPTDVAGQEAILKTIASSEDVFYSVTSAAGLQEAFEDFAGAVLYAAENAVFEDALGANFNIQLANTTTRLVDGEVFTLDPAPTIEVREYTIWTRAELEDDNGNLSEENAKLVGTRKTDDSGNYIYNTLEIVSFNAEGTEAYTGGDTTNNIMVEGVICAKTFWYNTNSTSVMIDADGDASNGDEFELKAETFLWKVGTIKSKQITLSYYVYLDDSLEGDASAGSYETNKYAILSYDNYLGNPCSMATVSPQMAWLSANVSYAYYLVNKDGTPVNANGDEVTFANREIVVHPTKYGEIKLNSITDVESLSIASTGILDEGNYALFDYDAEYILSVNSNATGGWEITVGDGLPATTYVTNFSDTLPFTNAIASDSDTDNYDYTKTTVWFAVVWEPKALDDTVVIDYGLPVDVHVLTNDFFGDFGTLEGVAAGTVTNTDGNVTTNEVTTTEDYGTFGSVEVIKPSTGANDTNSVIRYTPSDMQMNNVDVFTYSVDYTNTKLHTNNGFYYGKLTVIPATTVYYEDDFVTFTNSSYAADGYGVWTSVTDDTYDATADITQDEDRPDDINYAFDTVIDANNVYGYDSAYENCSQYSLGSAKKVSVKTGISGKASFDFYGTGFDVISMTDTTTGMILVRVFDEDNNMVVNTAVNNYFGYAYQDGEWVAVDSNDPNALYQVPVMKVELDSYGLYTAEIIASYNEINDVTNRGSYDFYLDAIRIYNPTGNENATANQAYVADGEGWPTYIELRNLVIDKDSFDSLDDEAVSGIVFIDGADPDGEVSISDYTSYGPNNELYLAGGQAVAFDLEPVDNVASVQLAIKSVGGTGSVKVYGVDGTTTIPAIETSINTATDMYYDITALDGKTVVILNTGSADDAIISITNIKTTFKEAPATEEPMMLMVSRASAANALATLSVEEDEESVPETTVPEETEPENETTVPEETEPEAEETKPSKPGSPNKEDKPAQNKPAVTPQAVASTVKKVVSTIINAMSNLLGRWF